VHGLPNDNKEEKMSDEEQLDEKIKNTEIKIGNTTFTPAKLMIAGSIVSAVLGSLYGAFEIYKDYMDMKEAIQTYVTPDLSSINQKIAVLEENTTKAVDYTRDINNNLKQDIRRIETIVDNVERNIKQSIRDVDNEIKEIKKYVENSVKEISKESTDSRRMVDNSIKTMNQELSKETAESRRLVDNSIKNMNQELTRAQKEITTEITRSEREIMNEVRKLRAEVDDKIKKALDNPLANQ